VPKLEKQLEKLRKQAGKVRDMDVQTEALQSLKVSSKVHHAQQEILEHLGSERNLRAKKLLRQLTDGRFEKLQSRLRKSKLTAAATTDTSAFSSAMGMLDKVAREFRVGSPNALNVENLHALRLRLKQVRYTAELAPSNPESEHLIESMKRIQDAIGEWHDWSELTSLGESLLADVEARALITAMRSVRNAKFTNAVNTSNEVITSFFTPRKSPQRAVAAGGTSRQTA
jgi:CHAD domain-containing protein